MMFPSAIRERLTNACVRFRDVGRKAGWKGPRLMSIEDDYPAPIHYRELDWNQSIAGEWTVTSKLLPKPITIRFNPETGNKLSGVILEADGVGAVVSGDDVDFAGKWKVAMRLEGEAVTLDFTARDFIADKMEGSLLVQPSGRKGPFQGTRLKCPLIPDTLPALPKWRTRNWRIVRSA